MTPQSSRNSRNVSANPWMTGSHPSRICDTSIFRTSPHLHEGAALVFGPESCPQEIKHRQFHTSAIERLEDCVLPVSLHESF